MSDDADRSFGQALALAKAGRSDAALATLASILVRTPTHHAALSLNAGLLMQGRRYDDADTAFHTLTQHYPNDDRAWLNQGHLLKATGRTDAALAAYRRSIAVAPERGTAWWNIADLRSSAIDDADIATMQATLLAAHDDGDRIALQFALARVLGDRGDAAAAFAHLRTGNALRLAQAPHDADATAANFRRTEALFTPSFFAARANDGAAAPDPIFIVGLPRSGSTLVEQILASHPLVEGCGELQDLHAVAREIPPGDPANGHLAGVAALPAGRRRNLGERYLQATRRHRVTGRPFFTDKMPSNWIYAPLIPLILPRARIVDVWRHPMACGFANYAQHYNWGNNFAYDLVGIGRFYADYVRHMAHTDAIAPGLVHHVHHEALVEHPEAEIRRLLDYLGLPFDPACLRFHENPRAVQTPSTNQVRRPINRDGLDRWRAYERWLDPLKAALGTALTDYPDR